MGEAEVLSGSWEVVSGATAGAGALVVRADVVVQTWRLHSNLESNLTNFV